MGLGVLLLIRGGGGRVSTRAGPHGPRSAPFDPRSLRVWDRVLNAHLMPEGGV